LAPSSLLRRGVDLSDRGLMQIDEVLKSFDLTFARCEGVAHWSFTRTGALPLGKLGDRLQVHPHVEYHKR